MELKPGYKQTELGVIPEDWGLRRLSQLAAIVRGGSPRPAGDLRYFNGNYIPWLTVAALTSIPDSELYVSHTDGYLTQEGSQHSRTLQGGTLIIANSGATLGVAKILSVTCCANDGIAALINQTQGDKRFLCHYLNSQTKRLREVVATGNGQPNLNTTLIGNVTVPFPGDDEQRSIAEALSDVDALIGALDKLIAKKRDIKQATMQQLLTGKQRLPGFSGRWKLKTFGDVLKVRHGRSQRGVVVTDGKYPILATSGEIGRTNQHLYGEPSVLIGRKGTIDFPQYVESPFWTIDTLFFTEISKLAHPKFIFYKFKTINWRGYNEASGVPSLNASTIESIEFDRPSFEEQAAIATVLSDMDAEITVLEQRREKTCLLKQGMMQELLTGRIRLTSVGARPVEQKTTTMDREISTIHRQGHNWQFNEAVVIAVLAQRFGNEKYPLGRLRYTKLSYLLHRQFEGQSEGYLKKAAGPYNPQTRYGGPERIAKDRRYVKECSHQKRTGFIAADNNKDALSYFEKWYGPDALRWLDQFRYVRNEDLELWTTVDTAVQDLTREGKEISVDTVKGVIKANPNWMPKLNRQVFSDENIGSAIQKLRALFAERADEGRR